MPRLLGTPQGLFWMSTVTVIPDFFTKGPHHGNVWDRQKSRDPCQRHQRWASATQQHDRSNLASSHAKQGRKKHRTARMA
jgi:hypothetical protein